MESPPKYSVKFWIMIVVMLIITVLLVWSVGGLTVLLSQLQQTGIFGLFGIACIYSIVMLIRVYRWDMLLHSVEVSVPFTFLAKVSWIAWAQNAVIPARLGEFTRLYYLKSAKNVDYSKTTASLVLEKFFDLFGLLSIVILAAFILLGQITSMPPQYLFGIKILIAFVAIAILSMLLSVVRSDWIELILQRTPLGSKALPLFYSFKASIAFVIHDARMLLGLLLLSTFQWLIESTTILLIVFLLHAPMDVPVVIFAAVIGYATYIFPITPGSLGTFEYFVAQILILLLPLSFDFALQIPLISHVLVISYLGITGIISSLLLKH